MFPASEEGFTTGPESDCARSPRLRRVCAPETVSTAPSSDEIWRDLTECYGISWDFMGSEPPGHVFRASDLSGLPVLDNGNLVRCGNYVFSTRAFLLYTAVPFPRASRRT